MPFSGSPLPAPKHRFFELPREHGAVAIFSLATTVSLFLCKEQVTSASGALLLLWLIMMSIHDGKLLCAISMLSMILMFVSGHSSIAIFFVLIFLGIEVTQSNQKAEALWWREIVGLSGAALAPLTIAFLIMGEVQTVLPAALALIASTMTGVCTIHVCRSDLKVNPLATGLLSLFFWIWLAAINSMLALISLIPYLVQIFWIYKIRKPNFKQLGIAQAVSLALVSLAILFLH